MMKRDASLEKIQKQVSTQFKKEKVQNLLDDQRFKEFQEKGAAEFSEGASKHFYNKVLELQRENSLETNLSNEVFYEYLYAALVAWGLERGDQSLIPFSDFKAQIEEQSEKLLNLEKIEILELDGEDTRKTVVETLSDIYQHLDLKKDTESRIVANSKLLHFLLPDLIPPMDNRYTSKLYSFGDGNRRNFLKVFLLCWHIGREKKTECQESSFKAPKSIDNAIIGYIEYLE